MLHLLHLLLRERGLTWHSTFTSVCACAFVFTTLIVNVIIYTQSLFIDTAGGDGQGYMHFQELESIFRKIDP